MKQLCCYNEYFEKFPYICSVNLNIGHMLKLRGLISLYLLSFSLISLIAQESNNSITSGGWTLGAGKVSVYDEYLSPLVYTGTLYRFDYGSMRFVSPDNNNISIQKTLMVSSGLTNNPSLSNSIFYFSLRPGLGFHYHFRPMKDLKVMLGGTWDLFFASKYNFNNGNNPYSADLSTHLNASAMAQYLLKIKNFPIMFRYSAQTPLIGEMFVPEYGASYYEMFTLHHMGDALHFASVNNFLAFKSSFTADFMFRSWILRLAYYHDYQKNQANYLHFETLQNVFSIGTVVNFSFFDRGKRKAPSSYNDINQ